MDVCNAYHVWVSGFLLSFSLFSKSNVMDWNAKLSQSKHFGLKRPF